MLFLFIIIIIIDIINIARGSIYVNMTSIFYNGKCHQYPFNYCIIDDILNNNVLITLLNDINNLNDNNANTYYNDVNDKFEYNKYAFNSFDSYHNLISLFNELNSIDVINHIESITGISNLITNDITLKGAGIHRIKKNGYLKLHTDFNSYISDKDGKLDRRINLLIYMNPNWKDEYNGHLWLCTQSDMVCIEPINPILNRAVLFATTNSSIHGHPIPLNVPDDGIRRHSIAVYYYTKNNDEYEKEITPTTWYEENEFTVPEVLIKFPVQIDVYGNDNEKTSSIIDIHLYKNQNIRANVMDICVRHNLDDSNCQNLMIYCQDQIEQLKGNSQ